MAGKGFVPDTRLHMPHLKATSRGTVSLSASICGFGISSIGLPIFHLHVISPSCNFCILSLYLFFCHQCPRHYATCVRLSAMHLALLNLIHRSIQHQIYRCDPWNFHIAQRMSNHEESLCLWFMTQLVLARSSRSCSV